VVGHLVAVAVRDVAVEAVLADVELPADEPAGEGPFPLADRVPVLAPVEQLGSLAGPEPLEVPVGLVVEERAATRLRSLKSSGGGKCRSSRL
jgi:hypothetical protein